jgi:hypothetical protein
MRPRRPFIGRPTLLVGLVALILGATVEAAPARSASAGIGSAPVAKLLARGAESLAGQIIGDYEFRHGTPNERSIFHGPAGLDVITLGYNAHDSIDGKAGEYVLIVSVRQSPRGQPDPDRLVAEKVDVYPGTGKNVSSFPIYTYTVAPTLDHGEQAWEVIVKIHEGRKNDLYDYTTGKPEAGHWLKLTAAAFQSLSAQALSILEAAPHHADIRPPMLPFPAPFVGTYARDHAAAAESHAAPTPSVYLNVPMADPERPATVPDYEINKVDTHDPTKFLAVQSLLSGITWSSWGGSTAVGVGRVEVESSDTRPGHELPFASQSATVSIAASDLVSCGGRQLYTGYTLTLTGADPEPRDFQLVKQRSLPCRIQALRYYAGVEKVADTTGDCLFRGVSEQLPSGFGYLAYCRMQWRGWGQNTTTGTGIARAVMLPNSCDGHEECDYGIRVKLTEPAWCPAYGMSYTRERLEVFGPGTPIASEPQTKTGVIAPSVERRLRATIGHGSPRRVYYDLARPSQHCQPSSSGAAHSASLDANTLAAHDAAILAARIRKDARRASGSPSAEVHVETGCCGVRVLTVLYRARPTRGGKYGAYVVQLVTGRSGSFTSAALLELRTARGYRYGEPQTKLLYQFGLFRKAPPNWGITTYPANDTIAPSATPLPPGATKQLTPAELEAAFSQAIVVLRKAEDRAAVSNG